MNPEVVEWLMVPDAGDLDDHLDRLLSRPSWMARAECVGEPLSTFFLDRSGTGNYDRARSLCGRCPVVAECLEHALADIEDIGFFGGSTGADRKRMRAEVA